MRKYRFHLLSLVHLPQSKEFISCAFTQKNRKLAKMLISLGHEVFFYGSEGSDIEEYCNSDRLHFIQTHTLNDIARDYGDGDNRYCIGYDYTNTDFRHDFNSKKNPSTMKFYSACITHINKIKKPGDFLLCSQGPYFKPIADSVGLHLTCEPGVGYRGSYMKFRAFESAYIQNFTYGSEHPRKCINGNYYDRVIPNYFDPKDITYSEKADDYFFFIGRMIMRKGILTAYLAAKEAGKKLIIAGQGASVQPDGSLKGQYSDFTIPKGNWEYVGFVNVEQRKKLMAKAIATFTPTIYMECFAGTHVESMLSGTPVITTNFAVFPGTVINGFNGYRGDTLNDFIWAAKNIHKLDRKVVRNHAERYLMDSVRWDFQKWFDDLYDWYESVEDKEKKGWHRILSEERETRDEITW